MQQRLSSSIYERMCSAPKNFASPPRNSLVMVDDKITTATYYVYFPSIQMTLEPSNHIKHGSSKMFRPRCSSSPMDKKTPLFKSYFVTCDKFLSVAWLEAARQARSVTIRADEIEKNCRCISKPQYKKTPKTGINLHNGYQLLPPFGF